MNIEEIRTKLQAFFATRPEVRLAYLFGSAARGRMNKQSDVDIAVLLDEELYKTLDKKEPYGYKAALIVELMGVLHTNEIDLVVLGEAPPLLAHEVICTGIVVFCRDERERIAFEVQTKKRYLDTKPLREIKRRYLYERIEQGRFSEVKLPSSAEK
jgi:hypothetical protein